jgi:hypothetical protein
MLHKLHLENAIVVCTYYILRIYTAYANIIIDRSHPQGLGKLSLSRCHVKFDIYIPLNWNRFPFVLFCTRGSHAHFPPPPTKLPDTIADEVIEAIKQHDLSKLSTRKLFYAYV